jgi:hypothetical protein
MEHILQGEKRMYSFNDGEMEITYDSISVNGNNVILIKDNKAVLTFGEVIDVESFVKTLK